MNKFYTIVLLVSSITATVISTIFGFAGQQIIGTFWGWFWVSLLIQIIGFALYNSAMMRRDETVLAQAEAEALEQLAKFTIRINCGYCQQPNSTPIQLNRRNVFKCESCNQVSGITMQFMATALTEPVQSVSIPVENSSSVEFKVS